MRKLDLTGKRFGRLRVLEESGRDSRGTVLWKCECECGNTKVVRGTSLKAGETRSCGCLSRELASKRGKKNLGPNRKSKLKGKKFGRLTVLKELEKRDRWGNIVWECECECGNITFVSSTDLKKGHTKSCGCLSRELTGARSRSKLVGKKFGRLTVVQESGRDKHQAVLWECKCECGNTTIASSISLSSGRTKSCGCLKDNPLPRLKLKGKKFGRWTVLKRQNRKWLCKCECGTQSLVGTNALVSGLSSSCGCYQRDAASSFNRLDLTNQRFGRLRALELAGGRKNGSLVWLCECDCGNEIEVPVMRLRNGTTKSCGCWAREVARRNGKHRLAQSVIFERFGDVIEHPSETIKRLKKQ